MSDFNHCRVLLYIIYFHKFHFRKFVKITAVSQKENKIIINLDNYTEYASYKNAFKKFVFIPQVANSILSRKKSFKETLS